MIKIKDKTEGGDLILNDITEYLQEVIAEMDEDDWQLYVDSSEIPGAEKSADGNYYFMSREAICPTDWQRIGKYGVVVSELVNDPSQEVMDKLNHLSLEFGGGLDKDLFKADYVELLLHDRMSHEYIKVAEKLDLTGNYEKMYMAARGVARHLYEAIKTNPKSRFIYVVGDNIYEFKIDDTGNLVHTKEDNCPVSINSLQIVRKGKYSALYFA